MTNIQALLYFIIGMPLGLLIFNIKKVVLNYVTKRRIYDIIAKNIQGEIEKNHIEVDKAI